MQLWKFLKIYSRPPPKKRVANESSSLRSLTFFKLKHKKLSRPIGDYVNGVLPAGDDEYQNNTCLTLKTFKAKKRTYKKFTLFGSQMKIKKRWWYKISQNHCINQLQAIADDKTINAFRCYSTILAWTVHTHSNHAFATKEAT